jgi:hypothetical protein
VSQEAQNIKATPANERTGSFLLVLRSVYPRISTRLTHKAFEIAPDARNHGMMADWGRNKPQAVGLMKLHEVESTFSQTQLTERCLFVPTAQVADNNIHVIAAIHHWRAINVVRCPRMLGLTTSGLDVDRFCHRSHIDTRPLTRLHGVTKDLFSTFCRAELCRGSMSIIRGCCDNL